MTLEKLIKSDELRQNILAFIKDRHNSMSDHPLEENRIFTQGVINGCENVLGMIDIIDKYTLEFDLPGEDHFNTE